MRIIYVQFKINKLVVKKKKEKENQLAVVHLSLKFGSGFNKKNVKDKGDVCLIGWWGGFKM